MADPINANPTVLELNQLPTRKIQDVCSKQSEILSLKPLLKLSLPSSSEDFSMQLPGLSDPESEEESDEEDVIDAQEIYDLVATISDPEHPLTLGQLAVINLKDIEVINGQSKNDISRVVIKITPTITHCSLATLIGLGIRVRLERCLPPRFRITILVKEGTHQSENQVNKQLNDKERVCAACENDQLLKVIAQMLSSCQ